MKKIFLNKPPFQIYPPDSRQFHNLTKIKKLHGVKELAETKTIKTHYKGYPRFDQVLLPSPSLHFKGNFYNVLVNRVSKRNFSEKPITRKQLSNMLYYACGEKKATGHERRFYPSAGAKYPLEVYLYAINIEGLREGLYHYYVKNNSLEVILSKSAKESVLENFNQEWLSKSGFLLIVTAIFDRNESKYGDRGYRHTYTEYGHLAQNVLLISTSLKLGSCPIGGFIDDGLNKLLDIDGESESVIGVIAIGSI